jgi:hypothetical protein
METIERDVWKSASSELRKESTMEQNKPPSKSPRSSAQRSGSCRSSTRSASNKSQKTRNSDSPSSSATNSSGRAGLNARLRSVLSHPLGLPLTVALHDGIDPKNDLTFLKRAYPPVLTDKSQWDSILENAVTEWTHNNNNNNKRAPESPREPHLEPKLTTLLSKKIEEETSSSLRSAAEARVKVDDRGGFGFIDILLSSDSGSDSGTPAKPLALIEVGRKNANWWLKLDQNVKYLKGMLEIQQTDQLVMLDLDKPVLLAVLTIEDVTKPFRVQLGVFLCTPKKSNDNDFRMTLLWHTTASNLQEASSFFGRFLRVAYCFGGWREKDNDVDNNKGHQYTYLSSNCCRVGDSVRIWRVLFVSFRFVSGCFFKY